MDDLFNLTFTGATFSTDRRHRLTLWRIWDDKKPKVMFIGLNPSRADENVNDPTMRSIMRIAKRNGHGGVYMTNLFTYRSTKPENIDWDDPNIPDADNILIDTSIKCKDVVFAWGANNTYGRDKEVERLFKRAMVVGLTKNGSPAHPLFIKGDTELKPYKEVEHETIYTPGQTKNGITLMDMEIRRKN
jgi:hypothetical protein